MIVIIIVLIIFLIIKKNQKNQKNQINNTEKFISKHKKIDGDIPNIIHFVYGFKPQTEEFDLFKFISINSAIILNKPSKVYFYYIYER